MSTEEDSWERLASIVRDRRERLGLTQEEAVTRAGRGVNRTFWWQVENARRNMISAMSEYALCRALGWTPDSVRRIHQGLEPVVIEEAEPTQDSSIIEMLETDPALDDSAREIILDLYRNLVRQSAARR